MFDIATWSLIAAAAVVMSLLSSIFSIGPTPIGLVRKRFGAKLPGDNPLALRGDCLQKLAPNRLRFQSDGTDAVGRAAGAS